MAMAAWRGIGYFEALALLRKADEKYGAGAGDFELAFHLEVMKHSRPSKMPTVKRSRV